MVNLYNGNTETEVSVLNHLSSLLEKFDVTFREKSKTFKLEIRRQRGKTYCQNKSLAKLIQLKGSHDFCDIWRIRNPVMSTFTFKQKHCTGFIQRRLDYSFISIVFKNL